MYRNLSLTILFSALVFLIASTFQPTSLEAAEDHDLKLTDESLIGSIFSSPKSSQNIIRFFPDNDLTITPGSTIRVSVDNGEIEGNDSSSSPSIASNGIVPFTAYSKNFSEGIGLYTRDFINNETEHVDIRYYAGIACISDNGQFITFASGVDLPESGDTNGHADVFVYDRINKGAPELVSITSDGDQGNGPSGSPSISGDGNFVVFNSQATNFATDDMNNAKDVFAYDRKNKKLITVSVSSTNELVDEGASVTGRCDTISADGSRIVFQSHSSNFVDSDSNTFTDIFVRDISAEKTVLVSKSTDGEQGPANSNFGAISANGQFVAFESWADLIGDENYAGSELFLHDMSQDFENGKTSLICRPLDGLPTYRDILCQWPSISGDGNRVSFLTNFGGLVDDDTNNDWDIFVYDRATNRIVRVSESSQGDEANARSSFHQISDSGEYVVFDSIASNLVSNDTNDERDIFVHMLPPAPATYEVSGKVTDHEGNPLTNVALAIITSDLQWFGGTSNSDGSYKIRGLEPGTYTLTPSMPGYTFSPSAQEFTVPQSQVVDIEGTPTEPSIEMPLDCPVPFYSQWGYDEPQDSMYHTKCGEGCTNIENCGCKLTAAAMIFSYYGADLDPRGLNTCLKNANPQIPACPFTDWTGLNCTSGKVTLAKRYRSPQQPFSWENLEMELNVNKRPVLLMTCNPTDCLHTEHWVVVTSGQGDKASNYKMHDPAFEVPDMSLDYYTEKLGNVFKHMMVYSGEPSCSSAQTDNIGALFASMPSNLKSKAIVTSTESLADSTGISGKITPYYADLEYLFVKLVASGGEGSVTDVRVWTDTYDGNWQPYNNLARIKWEADEGIYAQFRDATGNESAVYELKIWPENGPYDAPESNQSKLLLPLIVGK